MMVSGQLHLKGTDGPPVEVKRCMAVFSRDGRELGLVAAVYLDPHKQDVTAILLGRLPVTSDYRLILIDLIDHVSEDDVQLRITAESVGELAKREAR